MYPILKKGFLTHHGISVLLKSAFGLISQIPYKYLENSLMYPILKKGVPTWKVYAYIGLVCPILNKGILILNSILILLLKVGP